MTAILVDDEKIALERLELLIADHTYLKLLGKYSNPEAAKQAILKQQPDIVFSDVEMPGMIGIELAHQLKELGYKGKVVFITAYTHYAIKALRESAFDYLLKPVDVGEFKQMLERLQDESSKSDDKIETLALEFELTHREKDILNLLLDGASSNKMAESLHLSIHTINTHRKNLLMKLGVSSAQELLLKYFS